jgi:hypothetical protein
VEVARALEKDTEYDTITKRPKIKEVLLACNVIRNDLSSIMMSLEQWLLPRSHYEHSVSNSHDSLESVKGETYSSTFPPGQFCLILAAASSTHSVSHMTRQS